MNYNLIKQNRKISWFFLVLVIFFVSLLQKEINQFFSSIICFLLIATIGVSHGSLDNLKGKKLFKIYNFKNFYLFYLGYILISFLIIGFWLTLPSLTIFSFLLIASYHFGKEDTVFNFDNEKKINNKIELSFLLKGSMVVLAPITFHYQETYEIFSLLFLKDSLFLKILEYIKYFDITNAYNLTLLKLLFIISILSGLYLHAYKNSVGLGDYLGGDNLIPDFVSIIALNAVFSPLIAFTIYFCLLHSTRHTLSLIHELDEKNFKNGLNKFIKKALPLTIVTAIMFVLSVYYLANYYVLDDAILKVIFIGLASLTFPHILLEYLIEKNER